MRVMLDLALNQTGGFIPLKDISERQDITVKYLEQIVIPLTRAGYLKSSRGTGGGYRLARSPKEYKIGNILRVMEGNLSPLACLEDDPNECPRSEICPTLSFWEGLNRTIEEYVDGITLEDLLKKDTKQACAG